MGDVIGDLSSRRAVIKEMDDPAPAGVRAEVPLRRFSSIRRSCLVTQGRATYTMDSSTTRSAQTGCRGRHQQGYGQRRKK